MVIVSSRHAFIVAGQKVAAKAREMLLSPDHPYGCLSFIVQNSFSFDCQC